MRFFQRLRLLPLLILVASLALLVRAGEFAAGVEDAGFAFAQQEVDAQAPPLPAKPGDEARPLEPEPAAEKTDQAQEETKKAMKEAAPKPEPGQGEAAPEQAQTPAAPEEAAEKKDWQDPAESGFEYSEIKAGLYKDLVARREDLEKREKALGLREALLEAAERELDQKIREMTAVRNEIESLMKTQSSEEIERIGSLVKIYEGMKPGDAARIFNTLDMDVLIAVMARMSERKSGPILAEMNPERARSVTILLAQQKQIPEIPAQ